MALSSVYAGINWFYLVQQVLYGHLQLPLVHECKSSVMSRKHFLSNSPQPLALKNLCP